jgi:hypothetical protein
VVKDLEIICKFVEVMFNVCVESKTATWRPGENLL